MKLIGFLHYTRARPGTDGLTVFSQFFPFFFVWKSFALLNYFVNPFLCVVYARTSRTIHWQQPKFPLSLSTSILKTTNTEGAQLHLDNKPHMENRFIILYQLRGEENSKVQLSGKKGVGLASGLYLCVVPVHIGLGFISIARKKIPMQRGPIYSGERE